MGTVAVNPPKTPVTKGSNGIAQATLPNICKMPGPPAPFVPTPLPNIGKSGDSPKGYSKNVKFDKKAVAIQGASFGSMGDSASKGTGGGMVSMNTHGPTKFIAPGSLDVKVEGKNVQHKGDSMMNNCGPSGSPANSATLQGVNQETGTGDDEVVEDCGPGKHCEKKVERPDVPDSEKDPQGRIDAIKANPNSDAGDLFEARAAQYNFDKKHLTHGNQIGRKLTPAEEAAGLNGGSQQIWIICTVCGARRELDEAPENDHVVEAKCTSDAVEGGHQKQNNLKVLADGGKVTYKSPPIGYQKYSSWTELGFKMLSLPAKYL